MYKRQPKNKTAIPQANATMNPITAFFVNAYAKAPGTKKCLAVDEFAIHQGHSYATCVMNLEHGDILWFGNSRAMKDFEKFFKDVSSDSLSAVIAVAMEMNASYNKLVTKHGLYMIGFICSRNLAEMFSALFVWMKLAGIKPKKKKSLSLIHILDL